MNNTPKTEARPLWEIVRLFLLACILGFAAFSAIAVCFAQTLTPDSLKCLPANSGNKGVGQ
jgi:hypothetical protein